MDLSKMIAMMQISEDGESCKVMMCDGTLNYRIIKKGQTYKEIESEIEEELKYI